MQLGKQLPGGGTLREHLQAAAAFTGTADPRLAAAPPAGAGLLWLAFCECARPVGMGPGAIPAAEIEAWQRLSRVSLTPWEVDTLRAMDRAALNVMNEKATAP